MDQVIAEIKRDLERRDEGLKGLVAEARAKLTGGQRYVRGLFCGGTFCYEAMLLLRDFIGNVHSNAPLEKRLKLVDSNKSLAHTCVDLGEDEFTVGRLHPMLDLSLRNRALKGRRKIPRRRSSCWMWSWAMASIPTPPERGRKLSEPAAM